MKKILIATNVLLLGIILFQACNSKKENSASARVATIDTCNRMLCKPYDGVGLNGIVSGDVLHELSVRYCQDANKSLVYEVSGNHPDNDHNTAKLGPHDCVPALVRRRDALSMVFDLEKLKNFIWKVQKSVCKSGCDTSIKIGIRFYYIKYPDSMSKYEALIGLPRDSRNKHALAMVPVFQKPDGNWYDFYFNPDRPLPTRCVFEELLSDPDNHIITIGVLDDGSDGTNHGGVGPPPLPGTYPSGG